MGETKDLIFIFILSIFMIIMLIFIFESVIDKTDTIPEAYCKHTGGNYIFYECYSNPFSDCSKLKTGYWCEYPNGTNISSEKLTEQIHFLGEF